MSTVTGTPKEDLKRMVMQFRIQELELLLRYANQNHAGRKNDLRMRAMKLIEGGRVSISLDIKIRQLYQSMGRDMERPTSRNYLSNRRSAPVLDHSMPEYNVYSSNYSPGIRYNPQTEYNGQYPMYGGSYSGYSSYNSTPPTPPTPPVIPVVAPPNLAELRFRPLTFYKCMSTVSPMRILDARRTRTDTFEYTYSFTLTPSDLSTLSFSTKSTKEQRFQVQLRVCRLLGDEGNEVEDYLPLAVSVKVNDRPMQLPPAIPSTNRQGVLLKRMNAPVNLTPGLHRRGGHMTANTLTMSWSTESNERYACAIYLVKKYTADEMVERLKQNVDDSDRTKTLLKETLETSNDDEIAATSVKVSLQCPLGKIMMSLPVRATTCSHLQCFDGTLYVKMNDAKTVWMCPVCNKSCLYENLYVDSFFANLIKDNKFPSDTVDIQLNVDGTWTPILPRKRKAESDSEPKLKVVKLEPLSIDPQNDEQNKGMTQPSTGLSNGPRKTIDLQLSKNRLKQSPSTSSRITRSRPAIASENGDGNGSKPTTSSSHEINNRPLPSTSDSSPSSHDLTVHEKSNDVHKSIRSTDCRGDGPKPIGKSAEEMDQIANRVADFFLRNVNTRQSNESESSEEEECVNGKMAASDAEPPQEVQLVDLTESDEEMSNSLAKSASSENFASLLPRSNEISFIPINKKQT